MRHLRFILLLSVFFLNLYLFNNTLASAAEEDENNVSFRWAFGAIVGPKEDQRLVAITRDTTLKTGDQIKMLVELNRKCFIYVIHQGSDEEISLLFPYGLEQFDKDYIIGEKYYIPRNDMWFELDDSVGTESIYLVASSKRLFSLEELLDRYDNSTPGSSEKIGEDILSEIRNLKKKHRKFRVKAERPITIGGTVRGVKKDKGAPIYDIDPIADRVSAKDFYGRTFTIDHQ